MYAPVSQHEDTEGHNTEANEGFQHPVRPAVCPPQSRRWVVVLVVVVVVQLGALVRMGSGMRVMSTDLARLEALVEELNKQRAVVCPGDPPKPTPCECPGDKPDDPVQPHEKPLERNSHGSASPVPDPPRCIHSSEGAGACWYDSGVCTDGTSALFINPNKGNQQPAQSPFKLTYPYQRMDGNPKAADVPPAIQVLRMPHPPDEHVVWRDQLLVLNGNSQPIVFHSACDTVGPLMSVLRHVHMGEGKFAERDFDEIVLLHAEPAIIDYQHPRTWTEHTLAAVFKWWGFSKSLVTPVVAKQMLGTKRWICGRKGVIAGSMPIPISGRLEARLLRSAVLAYLNAFETLISTGKARVVLLDREPSNPYGRRFDNLEEMTAVLDKYANVITHRTVVVGDKTPYDEQVKMFLGTTVFIAAHGAGITPIFFMPEGSSVVEVFPFKVFRTPYHREAAALGLNYLAVYSAFQGKSVTWHYLQGWKQPHGEARATARMCTEASRVHAARERSKACYNELIHGSVMTPIPEFELALHNALDLAGVVLPPDVVPDILQSEGLRPSNPGAPLPMYPDYARDVMEPMMQKHGLEWDKDHV